MPNLWAFFSTLLRDLDLIRTRVFIGKGENVHWKQKLRFYHFAMSLRPAKRGRKKATETGSSENTEFRNVFYTNQPFYTVGTQHKYGTNWLIPDIASTLLNHHKLFDYLFSFNLFT